MCLLYIAEHLPHLPEKLRLPTHSAGPLERKTWSGQEAPVCLWPNISMESVTEQT